MHVSPWFPPTNTSNNNSVVGSYLCQVLGYIKDSQQYNRDAEGHICSHFLAYGVDGRARVITFLLLSFSVWQLWPTLSLSSSDTCILSSVSLHSPGLSSLSKASGSHCLAILSYRCSDPSFGCFQLCFARHLVLGRTANWDTDSKRSLSNGASLWGENSKQTIEQGERILCNSGREDGEWICILCVPNSVRYKN